MTRQSEVENRTPKLSELEAIIKSLPVVIYNGSEFVSGLATVENENVPPQTKRIIELAGHRTTGDMKVDKITYTNQSSSKGVNISVRWETDRRTHKYHVPSIEGVRFITREGKDQFEPLAIVLNGGIGYISEDYVPISHPEELVEVKKFLRKFKRLPASDRSALIMEMIDVIKNFPHKMPWNPSQNPFN